jgi:hypothetical protein
MQKKTGFMAYDWFKLIVAIILLLAIIILATSLPKKAPPPPPPPTPAAPEEAPPTEVPATEETTDETAGETNAEVELPPLPEPNAGLEYDADKGGLLNADGDLVYTLNEDGSGWTPVIPAEMASMQLDGEWTLLDADGTPAYIWDAETQTWLAVEQEETPAETAPVNTNIVDCPGAADPRLSGGKNAEVLRDVNFRSSPSVGENWIGGFAVGDQVAVMGETSCTPYGNGAYLWWQVERADGTQGWIAEAAANSPNYFLAPVE